MGVGDAEEKTKKTTACLILVSHIRQKQSVVIHEFEPYPLKELIMTIMIETIVKGVIANLLCLQMEWSNHRGRSPGEGQRLSG